MACETANLRPNNKVALRGNQKENHNFVGPLQEQDTRLLGHVHRTERSSSTANPKLKPRVPFLGNGGLNLIHTHTT